MKAAKIQSLRSLGKGMKAVAREERPAPPDAGKPSFNSVEARSASRERQRLRRRAFGQRSTQCFGLFQKPCPVRLPPPPPI